MVERPIDIALVEYWLGEWAYSMRAYREVDGIVSNDALWRNARRFVNEDYEDAIEDARLLGIVDAMDASIDSLRPHERWAIWHKYGIVTVAWPFARLEYATTLADAKMAIGMMMRGRGYAC